MATSAGDDCLKGEKVKAFPLNCLGRLLAGHRYACLALPQQFLGNLIDGFLVVDWYVIEDGNVLDQEEELYFDQ